MILLHVIHGLNTTGHQYHVLKTTIVYLTTLSPLASQVYPNIPTFKIYLGFPMAKYSQVSLKFIVSGNPTSSPYHLGLFL